MSRISPGILTCLRFTNFWGVNLKAAKTRFPLNVTACIDLQTALEVSSYGQPFISFCSVYFSVYVVWSQVSQTVISGFPPPPVSNHLYIAIHVITEILIWWVIHAVYHHPWLLQLFLALRNFKSVINNSHIFLAGVLQQCAVNPSH